MEGSKRRVKAKTAVIRSQSSESQKTNNHLKTKRLVKSKKVASSSMEIREIERGKNKKRSLKFKEKT